MSADRQQLIADLSADMRPVTAVSSRSKALLWTVGALLFVIVAAAALAPFRSGSLQQLLDSPQFLLETVIGLSAIGGLIYIAYDLGVPSERSVVGRVLAALAVLALWVLCYVVDLFHPALTPSTAGERHGCTLHTLFFSLPLLLAGLWVARRLWPLQGVAMGTLLGLAAGAVPALIMQFACMYVPEHILMHHILPGLSVGVVGALLGGLLLRPR